MYLAPSRALLPLELSLFSFAAPQHSSTQPNPTPNTMSTISLVKSAFGCKATLYTVLNCKKTSSQSELRSAYRKAALQFHPDRANASNNDNNGDTTLKFQAVSAAYQVLMDEQQRSAYDATGRVLEEHYDDDPFGSSSDNDEGNQQQHYAPRGKRQRPRDQKQQQWEDFFHSIFNEIISTGCTHEENAKVVSRLSPRV